MFDVTFDEDQSRTRDRKLAEKLAAIRRLAISVLKQHLGKHSIRSKRRIAGWSDNVLAEVLAPRTT